MSGRWIPAATALSLAALLVVGLWAAGRAIAGGPRVGAKLAPAGPTNLSALVASPAAGVRALPLDAEERAVRGPHPRRSPQPAPRVKTPTANERERAPVTVASRSLVNGRKLNVSWYGAEFQGLETASGELFDKNKLTAASRTLPFGTILRLTHVGNGHTVEVRVNDRGPWVAGRELDLSEAAFASLAPLGAGVIEVSVEILTK